MSLWAKICLVLVLGKKKLDMFNCFIVVIYCGIFTYGLLNTQDIHTHTLPTMTFLSQLNCKWVWASRGIRIKEMKAQLHGVQ